MNGRTPGTSRRLSELPAISQLRNRPRLRTHGPPGRPAPRKPGDRPKPPPRSPSSSLTLLSAPELRASRPQSSLNPHTDAFASPSTYPFNTSRIASHPPPYAFTLYSRTRQNSNSSPPQRLTSDARLLGSVRIGYFRALGGNDLKGAGRR